MIASSHRSTVLGSVSMPSRPVPYLVLHGAENSDLERNLKLASNASNAST